MLAMDVWCFSKSTIRVDLEKHQTRLHYWGNSLCNFEEAPLQFWVFLLCTKQEKKTALKKAEKEVATLEAKKAKADAKAAEEAKKIEAEAVLKKLLASGMSADEILEKLK